MQHKTDIAPKAPLTFTRRNGRVMADRPLDRRSFVKASGTAGLALSLGLAGCTQSGGSTPESSGGSSATPTTSADGTPAAEPETLSVTTPEGNLNIMHFLNGIDQGFWDQRNIDLNAKVTSFGRWANALTTGGQSLGTLELNSMATLVDEGEDLVHVGPNLAQINSIFVRPDSDIETVDDLQGATLGLPTWASGTATYIQAMIYDQFGFDIREETDNTTADPSSLWSLFTEQEEFDAMIQFTGYTVKGLANPDTVRPVFNAWEFWSDQTGYPPLITPWTARRSWLENNWDVAYRNLQAWGDAQTSFQENAEQVVSQYGRLAGLTDEGDQEAIIELANQGALTFPVEEVGQGLVDSQWRLLEAMAEVGSIPAVPSKEERFYTYEEVGQNANGS